MIGLCDWEVAEYNRFLHSEVRTKNVRIDMARPSILLVERHRAGHPSFADALKKRYDVRTVLSGKQAVTAFAVSKADLIVIDAISMNTPGDRIARQLKHDLPETPVIHLRQGSIDGPADIVLSPPFTTRKLNNAVDRLISRFKSPDGKPDQTLSHGPFILNVSRRLLTTNGQDTPLTPKLAQLVEMFFRNPGEVIDRGRLMEQVWQTNYMGDTRTLDVHIRWFRSAIETNPAKPVYLKTIRGIGYKFEIPPK